MNNRYFLLDFIRFLCALYVFSYHVLFRSVAMGEYNSGMYTPFEASAYGWIGVQIFFVISGFVIYQSALSKNVVGFIKGRILRLYPAYWICLIITVLIMFLTTPVWWDFEPFEILINISMLQGFVNIKNVDGVYWTLMYEIVFYFWVVVFISIKRIRYLKFFLLFLVVVYIVQTLLDTPVPGVINSLFLIKYSSYFLVGIAIYETQRDGLTWVNVFLLLLCGCAAFIEIVAKTQDISDRAGIELNSFIPIALFLISLVIIYFSSKLKAPRRSIGVAAANLGLMSYPLYLLHQNISYALITLLETEGTILTSVFIVAVFVLTLSYLVAIRIEPFVRSALGKVLTYFESKVRDIMLLGKGRV